MDHLTTKIKTELQTVTVRKEKELILKQWKIWLKSIPVIIGPAFDKNFTDLKTALLEWAELEEDALALLPDPGKKSRFPADSEPLKLDISVAILAYLSRLFKIHRVHLKERKHSEIIDHMVATYCTKQTTRMSRDSFYNCYKAPTTNVARALRKILRAILEDVDYFINTGEVRGEKDKP